MGAETKIEAAAFPAGLFAPVPDEHTVRSALATSLAMLRLYARERENMGLNAGPVRDHIAVCEPLVEL